MIRVFNVSAILHDIISKQAMFMGQQGNLMRMVQDQKAHNVCELTEAEHLTLKRFPIEDLRSLSPWNMTFNPVKI